jgi:hypothetical protein
MSFIKGGSPTPASSTNVLSPHPPNVMNRIGILGHRGWAAGHILQALLSTGATLKIIHRPGSDTSALPAHVSAVEASLDNEDALVRAFEDVDVMMCVQLLPAVSSWARTCLLERQLAGGPRRIFRPAQARSGTGPLVGKAVRAVRPVRAMQPRDRGIFSLARYQVRDREAPRGRKGPVRDRLGRRVCRVFARN